MSLCRANAGGSYTLPYRREAVHLLIDTGRPVAVGAWELVSVTSCRAGGSRSNGRGWTTRMGGGCRRTCRAGTVTSRECRAAHGPAAAEESSGSLRHRKSEPPEVYRLLDTEKASHQITRMAALLGVSGSGYYARTRREAAGPSAARQRPERLTVKITEFHADYDPGPPNPKAKTASGRWIGQRDNPRRHCSIGLLTSVRFGKHQTSDGTNRLERVHHSG